VPPRQSSASAQFHAGHNFYFLYPFEPVEQRSAAASYLIGVEGLLCPLVQVALAAFTAVLWRRGGAQTAVSSRA
jgi:hypothetical protein